VPISPTFPFSRFHPNISYNHIRSLPVRHHHFKILSQQSMRYSIPRNVAGLPLFDGPYPECVTRPNGFQIAASFECTRRTVDIEYGFVKINEVTNEFYTKGGFRGRSDRIRSFWVSDMAGLGSRRRPMGLRRPPPWPDRNFDWWKSQGMLPCKTLSTRFLRASSVTEQFVRQIPCRPLGPCFEPTWTLPTALEHDLHKRVTVS